MNTDFDTCTGERCQLKMTCRKYIRWMASDDDEEEPVGSFGEDCKHYEMTEYYGG